MLGFPNEEGIPTGILGELDIVDIELLVPLLLNTEKSN